jgi:hypothetical protein
MALLHGSTVFDRLKANGGYMTGPRHRMGPALEDGARLAVAKDGDEPDGGNGEPPNLHDAGNSMQSCADCEHYQAGGAPPSMGDGGGAPPPVGDDGGDGAAPTGDLPGATPGSEPGSPNEGGSCKLYGGYPVTPNEVCDSFEAQDDDEGPGTGEQPNLDGLDNSQ